MGISSSANVASAIGNLYIIYNQVASIFISIIAGTLSWILIEKRFIEYGKKFTKMNKAISQ